MAKLYWKSTCTTCRAARTVAREAAGASLEERNYAKEPLTEAEVAELVDLAGGVAAVLSTRTAEAKERGWTAASPPARDVYVRAAAANNNLVRRPIVVAGDRVVVGNDAAAIRAALG
ncbi:MAG: ArsC/Spx/MgsR family protein [Myxococcota bacterium]